MIHLPKMKRKTIGECELLIASQKGQTELVESLLASRAYPNQQNCQGMTSLCLASSMGHLAVIKLLIKNGADPLLGTKVPLLLAVEHEQIETANWLWKYYYPKIKSETLRYAIRNNKNAIVKQYFVSESTSISPDLFFACCFYGHKEVVKDAVYKKHMNPNLPVFGGWTAVYASVKHIPILSFFIGKCWDKKNCNGYSLLILATQWNAIFTVKWLITNKICQIDETIQESSLQKSIYNDDNFQVYPTGYSSLAIAVIRNHFEIVRLLVNEKANIYQDLPQHKTLLHLAIASNSSMKIIRFLADFFGHCCQIDDNGKQAIDYTIDQNKQTFLFMRMKTKKELTRDLARMFYYYCKVSSCIFRSQSIFTEIASYLTCMDDLVVFTIK